MSPVSSALSAGSRNETESAVWPGVATTCKSQPVDVDDLAVGERVGADAARRVEGAYGAALALGERGGDLGVVEVVVGEQDEPTSPVVASSEVEVAVLDRARVDHDRVRGSRARAAPRCWCRRAS